MSVTLVATAGSSSANSYIDVIDATAILEEYLTSITSGWDAASATLKAQSLIQGTRDIDTLRLIDEPYTETQALHFPTDIDAEIPDCVERATCLQAAYLLRSGTTAQKVKDMIGAGIQSQGAGRLSQNLNKYNMSHVCEEALAELSGYIINSVRVERG